MKIESPVPTVEEYQKLRNLVGWWDTDHNVTELALNDSPNFQAKGIGKALMEELMRYLKANANPGSYVALLAAKGLEKFYRNFGFKTRHVDAPGMFQVL